MKTIPWWSPQIKSYELDLVKEVLESGYINEGLVVTHFESRIAELVGSQTAIATTSGTTAIFLALTALGVGPGDEVIVPDVTFIATANAVTLTGAKPVLVDVNPQTLNVSVAAVESAIGPKTKTIVPVHVSGRGADMKLLLDLAEKHRLTIVEDACESLRSKHKGRFLGTWGQAGCFSFSPNKTITCGQGGMIVTNDLHLASRIRALKDQGRAARGTGGDDLHLSLGFNFKLTNLQAAVALGQLAYLDARLTRQRKIHQLYRDGLQDIQEIEVIGFDLLSGEVPQWTDALCDRRDELEQYLRERGAFCRKFWHPLHTQLPYLRSSDDYPNALTTCPRALWLPSAFTLTDGEVHSVVTMIRAFYEGSS